MTVLVDGLARVGPQHKAFKHSEGTLKESPLHKQTYKGHARWRTPHPLITRGGLTQGSGHRFSVWGIFSSDLTSLPIKYYLDERATVNLVRRSTPRGKISISLWWFLRDTLMYAMYWRQYYCPSYAHLA